MSLTYSRIFYIDALKALAIVLVVMGHTVGLWEVDGKVSFYQPVLSVFHMPLFMALSGYVTNVESFQLKKRAKMLIPFFVFAIAWGFYKGLLPMRILGFFTHEAKWGYWFLYVLFVFFVFLSMIRATKRNLYVGMAAVQMALMGLHGLFHSTDVGTTISTDHMFQMWPFFCLGIAMRRGMLASLEQYKRRSCALCLLGILFIRGGQCALGLAGTLAIYTNDLMSLFIVPLLFLLFHEVEFRLKGKHSRLKTATRSMGHRIGVSTLQIYVLQYFAIDIVTQVLHRVDVDVSAYELVLSPVLAILLCEVCVFISNLLHKMRLGFVFGR